MEYIVVFMLLLNVLVLSVLLKTIVLYAIYKAKKHKSKMFLKSKKNVKKSSLQYFNNVVYKAHPKTKHLTYINAKSNKALKQTKFRYNKTNKKFKRKLMLLSKNLQFNLYSKNSNYFIKNVKILVCVNNNAHVIKSKKYYEIKINKTPFIAKTSVYSNKSANVLIVPVKSANVKNKTKNKVQSYNVLVKANILVSEPTAYIKKSLGASTLNYNSNYLTVNYKNIVNRNYNINNIQNINSKNNLSKFTHLNNFNAVNNKNKLNKVKNISNASRLNKQLSVFISTSGQVSGGLALVELSCSEFNLIKTEVIKSTSNNKINQQNKNLQNKNLLKYLFKTETQTNKNFVNKTQSFKELSYNKTNSFKNYNNKIFSYYIKTKCKNINYLVNSFLPQKVITEFQNQSQYNSINSFIKSHYNKELVKYNHNKIIKWLLDKRSYTELYCYLMHSVIGVVFGNNCINFNKTTNFFGKIYINYEGTKVVKYNNYNGFYYVYNNIIYNNVPVLQLKDELLQVPKIN